MLYILMWKGETLREMLTFLEILGENQLQELESVLLDSNGILSIDDYAHH